ncbi:MAG: AAA family ATPase [Ktedonobacteraceae bacterium]|nr:AAA family ATPase [Ktedonobacteraceae bacterium]
MQHTWRPVLKKNIEDRFIQHPPEEWYDLTISTSGLLNITIVSEHFANIAVPQRREQIVDLLHKSDAPTSIGFLSLYTISEADFIGLSAPLTTQQNGVYSWSDLTQQAINAAEAPKIQRRKQRIPRTITFYSFKGGVGRTTALTHVAWILAMRGRKVVAIDLDLEAPGLSSLLNLTPTPEHGIVDYFYERSYLPKAIEPSISIAEIFGEVRIPDAPGRLFIVPAGSLDLNYITKVDDLRASAITERGEDLWSIFFREITEQLQPDIILVDSRTGINEWGAFSLLRAADQAIVFLYPNEQNKRGVELLLEALAGQVSVQLVFSPVPFGDAGMEKVKEYWQVLQSRLDTATFQPNSELDEDIQETEIQPEIAEPITVHYLTELALASGYPVQSLLSNYMAIANVVDEDTTAISLEQVLSDRDRRRKIIESLEFSEVNADDLDRNRFQRTRDFERFLDDTTCLIRGLKGTGKTALYKLLLKYEDVAREWSKRLDRVTCLSGHGGFRIRPTRAEFELLDQAIEQNGGSWEAFWRSYLLLRMHLENRLQQFLKGNKDKFSQLRSILNKVPRGVDRWQIEHTQTLVEMAVNAELNLLAKDALDDINRQLRKSSQALWFLYDDLDEDLLEKGNLRKRALTGLFQLVQASDARRLTSIRFKIFLREDIWTRLVFDNKSHLNGRDVILQWTRLDFLRLALRQAQQSEEFRDLVDRFAPVENIDQADEALIDRALQILWGTRREPNLKSKSVSRWVYDRLTDSGGTTFPRSLNSLLKEAKNYELTSHRSQPDRLLQPKSLNQGLFAASQKRCAEVREEYPELGPFLDALVGIEVLASEQKLSEVWQKTAQGISSTFSGFVDFLLSIGLIGLAELQEKEQGYRFAEIYTYGFNMYRGKRKY